MSEFQTETRPVLFMTFAYDDPEDAPVLDVSGSLKAARRNSLGYGYVYRLERLADGAYGNEQFIEEIQSVTRPATNRRRARKG